jgi:hypothetical protein
MEMLSRVAPGFFRIVQDVIRDDMFIALSRLTDKSKTGGQENLTLVSMVELIERTESGEFVSEVRTILDQLLMKVDSMRSWRNKWLAHLDFDKAIESKLEELPRVLRGDIDEALRLTCELMNAVAGYLDRPINSYDDVILPGDADALISALERGLEH